MVKLGLCLVVLLVCVGFSTGGPGGFKPWKSAKKWHKLGSKKLSELKKNPGLSNEHLWKGKRVFQKKMDFEKMSNPEMLVMMRMKKILSPLRQLFTEVLALGHQESIDGRADFCGEKECPAFTVLNKTAHYELRQYSAADWVSISVTAPLMNSEVQSSLFWPLFKYIQGNNELGTAIKMSVPVTTLVQRDPLTDECNFTMSLFIPSSLDNPPTPNNDKVFIEKKPSFKVYVHSFKGYAWKQSIWEKHVDMLQAHLDKDGLQAKYHPRDHMYMTAGYDDPIKMFNRHNEVWIMTRD